MTDYDAVVVGAGPNGLAAAAHLTERGRRVLVVEADDVIGGGARTQELTLPGYLHDVCSAIHPLGIASPFFRSIDLAGKGLDWIHPEVPMAHPLGDGRVAGLFHNLDQTAEALGRDAGAYRSIVGHAALHMDEVAVDTLGPPPIPPQHPLTTARFGAVGSMSASMLVRRFSTEEARAMLAGLAAHAIAPLNKPFTAAVAMLFAATAHGRGWPLARSGSRAITDALAAIVTTAGGSIETGRRVESLHDLPDTPAILLDVMPAAAGVILGDSPSRLPRRLQGWRHGPGVFKVDWALDAPIPWADDISGRAGTVHVGGTYAEVAAAEAQVADGDHPERPFVIVAQQSLFDDTRAPGGKHTGWAYCHIPARSTQDMTEPIEAQIERFAPGFRDTILARHTMGPSTLEEHNPNYVGGDIAGGSFSLGKLFQFGRTRPYQLADGIYLCSSATPPGAGVHGMCGYHAARAAST